MAGASTVREATQPANRRLTPAVVWKRQPGGTWWPHMDIWNAGTERDDAIRARRSRPTSRSESR